MAMSKTQAKAYNAQQQAKLTQQLRVATGVGYQAAKDAARPIAFALHSEIVTSLVGPGGGRVYIRHNPYRVHIASAPYRPPATDLGRLTNSYKIERIRTHDATQTVEVSVASHLDYAIYLEFGTRRMLPRPHVRPAGRRTAALVPGLLRAAVLAQRAQLRATGGNT